MSVGFFTFSRLDNLLPKTSNLSSLRYLTRSDLQLHADGLLVQFRSSKTNQLGDRTLNVPLASLSIPICPVQAVTNMFRCSPSHPSAPAFSYNISSNTFFFLQNSFIATLRSFLSHLGFDAQSFSSMRRGGATQAFRSGVPGELIKSHGDWTSEAYLTYLELSHSQKLQVSRTMAHH